jgi:hypothetical protein
MSDAKMFFGGMPTAIDVKKLEERFGVPDEGTLIPHADIAACIGVAWRSARYTTVLASWRKKLESPHNLHTGVIPGEGLKILTADEAVDWRRGDWRRNVRGIKRTAMETKRIDPSKIVNAEQLKVRDKLEEVSSRVFMYAAQESKALRPPTPPAALPRRSAVK